MAIKLALGQKAVYQADANGYYVGETAADPDPLTEGVWLVPAGAVETAPPTIIPAGKIPQWVGYKWKMVNLPE